MVETKVIREKERVFLKLIILQRVFLKYFQLFFSIISEFHSVEKAKMRAYMKISQLMRRKF